MCLVDYSDGPVEVLRELTPTAIKQHKCAECFRVIDRGEQYTVTIYSFDGELKTHKTCAHCIVVREWLSDECGGFLYGGVEEDAREHCDEGLYGMDLFRAVVGMQWQWRAKSGRLLPVPRRIKTSDEVKRLAAREEAGG